MPDAPPDPLVAVLGEIRDVLAEIRDSVAGRPTRPAMPTPQPMRATEHKAEPSPAAVCAVMGCGLEPIRR